MPKRKIKLYADEDIPSKVVKFIRNELCWDARYVCEEKNLQEREDVYHHRKAREKKRILLTRDKDYLDPCRFPFYKSPGVIIVEEKDTDRMIYTLHLLSSFLNKILKEEFHLLSFFKMIVSTSGVRLRHQERSGEIKEKFYPWKDNLK